MSKSIKTVILNDLQIATFKTLKRIAVTGIVKDDVLVNYKQNVIWALIRKGALTLHRNVHVRVNEVVIERKPDITPRKPKDMVTVSEEVTVTQADEFALAA